jgi:predicted small metal-binding protein
MKTMTCRQLGGACDQEFRAASFAEIAEMSKQHGMEMFHARDEAHIQAMNEMKQLMQKPGAMDDWFERKRKEFAAAPESM